MFAVSWSARATIFASASNVPRAFGSSDRPPAFASMVEKACTSAASDYFSDLAKRSHQRIDEGVDVRWEWAEPAK